ncbi:MAG: DUF488 family protein [Planctomycetota bacterium]
MHTLYTIGHSNHAVEHFLQLLQRHDISAIADVRSSPYSRHASQFNREVLQAALKEAGIAYVFVGSELGARREDPSCYENSQVSFERVARTDLFKAGLTRLRAGAESYRIAMMCSEKDPIGCHRMILVCRHLRDADMTIAHILEDGELEDNNDAERRLMRELDIAENHLFATREELVEEAYDIQGGKIAYRQEGGAGGEPQPETME